MSNKTIGQLEPLSSQLTNNDSFIIYVENSAKGTYKITYQQLAEAIAYQVRSKLLSLDNETEISNTGDIYLFYKNSNSEEEMKKISLTNLVNLAIDTNAISSIVNNYLTQNPVNVSVNPEAYLGDSQLNNIMPIGTSTLDLNDCNILGRYYCGSTVDCANISNTPFTTGNEKIFNLIIEKLTNDILRQTIRVYNSNEKYIRDAVIETNITNTFIQQEDISSFSPDEVYYQSYPDLRSKNFKECWEDINEELTSTQYTPKQNLLLNPDVVNFPTTLGITFRPGSSVATNEIINDLNSNYGDLKRFELSGLQPQESPGTSWTFYGSIMTGTYDTTSITPTKTYYFKKNFNAEQSTADRQQFCWQLKVDDENNIVLNETVYNQNTPLSNYILQIVFNYFSYVESQGSEESSQYSSGQNSHIILSRGSQNIPNNLDPFIGFYFAGYKDSINETDDYISLQGADLSLHDWLYNEYGDSTFISDNVKGGLVNLSTFLYDTTPKHIVTQDETPQSSKNYYILETESEDTYTFNDWQALNSEQSES